MSRSGGSTDRSTDRDRSTSLIELQGGSPRTSTRDADDQHHHEAHTASGAPITRNPPPRGDDNLAVLVSSGDDDDDDSEDDEAWVAELLLPARVFVRYFYVPILDADNDDAVQRFRKGMVTVTLVGLPAALLLAIGNYVSDAGSRDWTAAKGFAVFGPLPLLVALPIVYARIRVKRIASEFIVQVFVCAVIVFYVCMTISTTDVGWQPSWIQCGIVVLLSRTRYAPLWWILTGLGMLLSLWNDATAVEDNDLAAVVPGANQARRRLAVQLVFAVPISLASYVYLGILQFQLTAAEELANQSRVSSAVAQFLAQLLNTGYDTERAARLIQSQRDAAACGERMVCQPAMLDAFDRLVANLATYRPHIPNWLIATGGDGSDGAALSVSANGGAPAAGGLAPSTSIADAFDAMMVDPGSVNAALFQHTTKRAIRQNTKKQKQQQLAASVRAVSADNGDDDDPDLESLASFAMSGDLEASDTTPRHQGAMSNPAASTGSSGAPGSRSFGHSGSVMRQGSMSSTGASPALQSTRSPAGSRRYAPQAPGGGAGGRGPAANSKAPRPPPGAVRSQLTTATVVVAQIAFEIDRADELPKHVVADAIDGVVERIFLLANQTGAAAHSFVGDVATLSWNAANRVHQAEAKAAKFLARLRVDCGNEHAILGGAAFAAIAHVGMNGRGAGQRAVTIQAPWWPVLQRLFELGRHHATFVVNQGVRTHCEFAARCRGVGGLEAIDWRKHAPRRVGLGAAASTNGEQQAAATADVGGPSHPPPSGGDLYGSPSVLLGARTPTVPALSDAAVSATPPPQVRVGVFEVVSEVADTGDGEWMYVLQEQAAKSVRSAEGPPTPSGKSGGQSGVSSALTRALDLWLASRDGEAAEALSTLSANVVPAVALDGFAGIPGLRHVFDANSSCAACPAWNVVGGLDA